jgi:hypothetical protein
MVRADTFTRHLNYKGKLELKKTIQIRIEDLIIKQMQSTSISPGAIKPGTSSI